MPTDENRKQSRWPWSRNELQLTHPGVEVHAAQQELGDWAPKEGEVGGGRGGEGKVDGLGFRVRVRVMHHLAPF